MATRAGPKTEKPAPCNMAAPTSIQYSMKSKWSAMPTQRVLATRHTRAKRMTVRFGRRSAATPPNGVNNSMGIPKPRNTPPRPCADPVIS